MPLASLPPEPVITDEEFERDVDLMMMDDDSMLRIPPWLMTLKYKLDGICLLETMVNEDTVRKYTHHLPYDTWIIIPSVGKSGGMAFGYFEKSTIEILGYSLNMIHILCDVSPTIKNCVVSFVYGFLNASGMRNQWNFLSDMNDNNNNPWLLLGEFNFILHDSDKQGGNSNSSFPPNFVKDKLPDMNMHEVVSFGNPYTWCNRRFKNPNELIFEKFDRTFMNDRWVSVLPQTRATNLGRLFSDHCPVLVKCFHWVRNLNIPYKFFKCWQINPEFKEVLNDSWSKRVVGSPTFVVVNKLKHVKFDLSKWNVNSFGHIKTTIGRLNSELEKLQALPYSPQIGQYILNYSKQLDYWNMYNTIHTIRDDQGNWLEDKDQVTHLLSMHFKKIFTSSSPGNNVIEAALRFVTPIISDEVNSSLIAIPSTQKIRDTVNSLASWSSSGPDGFQAGFFQDNWDIVQAEFAFVANRQIHDNVVITQEIMLEWSFILAVFKKLGFSDEWCHMISQCISTVSYSVLVNGSPSEPFYHSRGIRQGECLSPYIFILCMEVLSQLLVKAEDEKLIQGFRFKKNSPSISHLFFAGDCMLFYKASVSYAKNLLKIIDTFAQASRQAINFEKSGFITSKKMIPSTDVDHFMFIDGSFKDYNMGLGVIWCDIAGNVRRCRSDYGLMSDAIGAEVAALILAISWAE
ncbi:uncharacterized protein LOC113306121 [Papaver somniferum]|uniref:uncharacterized protein LOC113306121 n=1 Tax=Papaver somniferum TaxID=3469 RepID=UPI000E6FCE07|nr:uncharacterized protein LOC113306121 [Papaver somniferum]